MPRTDETIEALADSIVSRKLDRNTIVASLKGLIRIAQDDWANMVRNGSREDCATVERILQDSKE